ncbi:T9SS type A sorting domain-containing protein, partial [Xanthomarina sp. F2636L]|uniref:T9SS type A sorting domain-containing protein n=1 Tax=Xanthomarina sp. F2636L TaxID=2996018 RepID=UPI00225E5FC9
FSQGYEYSLNFLGVNANTGNYQIALVATPDFEQVTPAATADLGASVYLPSELSIDNFETADSNLQFFEWQVNQEASFDGGITDLLLLIRSDVVPNNFTHAAGEAITLINFDIINEIEPGVLPTSGELIFAENDDPIVIDNYHETWLNINLWNGAGTQNYYSGNNPAASSINFATLSVPSQVLADTSISVYPNPTSDYINISTSYQIQQVEVFDILGKKVKVVSNSNQIAVTNLQAGIYIVKVFTDKGKITKKIVIE